MRRATSCAEVLASISSSITHQIAVHGIYAVFGLMAIDAVFPAASELVMVTAGASAAGAFSTDLTLLGHNIGPGAGAYVALALAGTLGYLIGGLGGWWIGVAGGRPLLERHGRLLHLSVRRLDRAERWFQRWGARGVLLGRLTPLVRSFISIPAGVFKMPLGLYAALTLVGSALWAFGFAGAGWAFGSSYGHFHHAFRYVEYAVVAVVAVTLVHFLNRKIAPGPRERAE